MESANTKIQTKVQTIDEYIALFPEDVQAILEEIRQIIKRIAPAAKETIKYQMPTFTLQGNLIHFAAFKNHIGFYGHTASVIAASQALAAYATAKGAIQFPLNKPIPFDLINRLIELRVKEMVEK